MKFNKAVLTSAILSSLHFPAFAEDTQNIEVIEVKGEFKTLNLKSTPASIGIIGSEAIDRKSATHLEEILTSAANLNFAGGTSRARFFQIRGLGAQGEYFAPVNYPVGLYIDDIDFSVMASGATLFDVNQVEVFRGPQGTRFGANALAGLIYLKSNAPTNTASGKLKLGVGNYNTKEIGLAYSNGLTKDLSYRVSAHQFKNDGFIRNDYLKAEDTNNRDELSLKGTLRFSPSADFVWDLNLYHINIDNSYDAFSLDNTRVTYSDQPGRDAQKSNAISSNLKIKLSDSASFQSIFTYAESEIAYEFDIDWSYIGIAPGWEYSQYEQNLRDKSNYTGEFRFMSEEAGLIFNDTTSWVIGAYYQKSEDELNHRYTKFDIDTETPSYTYFDSNFENEKQALFVQTNSQLSANFDLSVGFRYEQHQMTFADSNKITASPDYNMLGGKVSLGYKLTQDLYAYGLVSRGYMTGGVSLDANLTQQERTFEPEFLWNYETGLKYQNESLFVRLAAFYMDREAAQITRNKVITNEDNSSTFIPYTTNAETGFSKGLELETNWFATNALEMYLNLGYLVAEFENLPAEGDFAAIEAGEFSQTPTYTLNLGLNLSITDQLWLNLELDRKDEFRFSDDHDTMSLSKNLVNASLNIEFDALTVKVWGRNLFDQDTYTQGFSFPNDPRTEYPEQSWVQYGEPRVFGVTAEYSF
ncbi:TonB-dependent receptor [Catenovulum maritimum]|uniref:TonB-dependent receptor n=1 Tax=Catenovulum maritimum TaxID=1513271 RepID=A0A0J8JK82_9ALTE|nr:TonB-dependent receptor [Catenovulum maritimum]KMT64876.1 hypothetical protein XM47_11735 [Catenovulum maritimum]